MNEPMKSGLCVALQYQLLELEVLWELDCDSSHVKFLADGEWGRIRSASVIKKWFLKFGLAMAINLFKR